MNIGIIVHSNTGTTLRFGKLILENLQKNNHVVELIELKTNVPITSGSVRQPPKFSLLNVPDCQKYDAVLVGGPVWAFSASPVLMACLADLKGISGKKLMPFVTMGFPFSSMGGSQAISLMSSTAAGLGATVLKGKIINKLFHNYNLQMEKAAAEIASSFDLV